MYPIFSFREDHHHVRHAEHLHSDHEVAAAEHGIGIGVAGGEAAASAGPIGQQRADQWDYGVRGEVGE